MALNDFDAPPDFGQLTTPDGLIDCGAVPAFAAWAARIKADRASQATVWFVTLRPHHGGQINKSAADVEHFRDLIDHFAGLLLAKVGGAHDGAIACIGEEPTVSGIRALVGQRVHSS